MTPDKVSQSVQVPDRPEPPVLEPPVTGQAPPAPLPSGLGRRRRTTTPTGVVLWSLILIVAGCAIAIQGVQQYNQVQPIPGGIRTTGTVVGVRTGETCGKDRCNEYWVPRIRFTTSDGKQVVFQGPQQDAITNGTQVIVDYDPHDPTGAHDLSAHGEGGYALAAVGVGVFVAVVGLLYLLARVDRARRRIVSAPVSRPDAGRYRRFSRTIPGALVNAALVAAAAVLVVANV